MADWTTKAGDTWPNMDVTLTANGAPINLTLATSVTFLAKGTGGSPPTITRACTVTSAVDGEVTVDWQTSDLSVVGTYQVEFEIVWSNGDIGTVPNNGYKSLEIMNDLN